MNNDPQNNGPKVYAIDGVTPVIDPTAYVHPTAVLIGDVIIGPGCYVGPLACLRGDFGRLIMEQGSNLQDTCVVHGFPGSDTVIEVDGHIGHGAVIHGARIGRNALVGMNSVVMDGAVIGEASIVAAMSFVKTGMQVPPKSLVMGMPARVVRTLSDEEIEWKFKGTLEYQQLAIRCRQNMHEVAPLRAVEPDRKRLRFEKIEEMIKPKSPSAEKL
ncbi:MAG: phenylacetic acid degradation protein PaaY [Betaproteobacteria bacterium]|nr:phenylacetic acid degradation protein PaaY [Betaproteobacteria bacterium]